jgi:hypothetical protein
MKWKWGKWTIFEVSVVMSGVPFLHGKACRACSHADIMISFILIKGILTEQLVFPLNSTRNSVMTLPMDFEGVNVYSYYTAFHCSPSQNDCMMWNMSYKYKICVQHKWSFRTRKCSGYTWRYWKNTSTYVHQCCQLMLFTQALSGWVISWGSKYSWTQ